RVAGLHDELIRTSTNTSVTYLASAGEVKDRLTAKSGSRAEAEELIRPVADAVAERLGDRVFTSSDEDLEQVIGRLLKAARMTVAAAESLTGGGLAVRLS